MIRVDLTKRKAEKKPDFMELFKEHGITGTGKENAVALKVVLKGASWGRDFEAQANTDENKLQLTIETEDGRFRHYLTIYRFKNDGHWNGFASAQIDDILKMTQTWNEVMYDKDLGVNISTTSVTPEHFTEHVIDKSFAITAYLDEFQGKLKLNIAASLADWEAVNAEETTGSSADDLL